MKMWPSFYTEGGFSNSLLSCEEGHFYDKKYKKLYQDGKLKTHSWAYPFGFNFISNGALAITPAKNLIQNIGLFGVHSDGKPTKVHSLKASEDYTFDKEPSFLLPNRSYEIYHFKNHIKRIMGEQSLLKRIFRKGFNILGLG